MTSRVAAGLAACLLVFSACGQKPGSVASPTRPAQEAARSNAVPKDADGAILAVSEAVSANKLTTLAPECVGYDIDQTSDASAYVIQVREVHDNARCGGDPATSPRLFTVKVNRATGALETDAGSAEGRFHPIEARK